MTYATDDSETNIPGRRIQRFDGTYQQLVVVQLDLKDKPIRKLN